MSDVFIRCDNIWTYLDLHIKHSMRIDLKAEGCLNVMGQALLVTLLDRGPLLLERRLLCKFQQTL